MLRASALMLAAPLAVAAGAPAFAADIPGNSSTKAVLPLSQQVTQGRFETPGDSDWYRVTLKKGQDYTVSVSGAIDCCSFITANLRDSTGKKVLATAENAAGGVDDGFEFRAPYSGLYFLEYKQNADAPPDNGPYLYGARISTDCRAGTTTRCTIAVGQTLKGLLAFGYDKDWFRTTLSAGKTYSVASSGGTLVYVLDANGRLLAGGTSATIKGLSVPRNGTYYVKVSTTDPQPENGVGTTYTVSLTSP